MDAIDRVLDALREVGIEAFLAYGTLLGAVRDGRLIGHDSDADLGYVSRLHHPVDVIRESFRVQRALVDLGYRIVRYSALAFKVDVEEGDGVVRGLDVFGGFLMDGHLHLMGEIREPFREESDLPARHDHPGGPRRSRPRPTPTGSCAATYGPRGGCPTRRSTSRRPPRPVRRLNGWFRGLRVGRARVGPDLLRAAGGRWPRARRRSCGGWPSASRTRRRTSTSAAVVASDVLWMAGAGCRRSGWTSSRAPTRSPRQAAATRG